jgi:hypothetical protein
MWLHFCQQISPGFQFLGWRCHICPNDKMSRRQNSESGISNTKTIPVLSLWICAVIYSREVVG